MIGTLIGLINMLKNLSDSDMETLGSQYVGGADLTFFLWFAVGACPVQPHRVEPDGPGRRGDPCRQIIVAGKASWRSSRARTPNSFGSA